VLLDNGVTIIGGDGLERFIPKDASNMFSGNIFAFLEHFWDSENKAIKIDPSDEIMGGCLITADKKIIHERFINI
jgi:NAD(P) transhydrogenase subunit alpha